MSWILDVLNHYSEEFVTKKMLDLQRKTQLTNKKNVDCFDIFRQKDYVVLIQLLIKIHNQFISQMTLYIGIQSVSLLQKPSQDICLLIQSSSATLKTETVSRTKSPLWKDSLICSSKQQYLIFKIVYADTIDTIDSMVSFATGEIYFIGSGIFMAKDSAVTLEVTLMSRKQKKIGSIQLTIQYDKSRNYLGEIQFFDIDPINYSQNMLQQLTHKNHMGLQTNNNIELYKGPCRNKNLFSCMDQSIANEKFTWVEKKYRYN